MNFKPSNFYIGTVDLFAVLLPGAIATMMIEQFFGIQLSTWVPAPQEYGTFHAAVLFLLASYLLGHVISQVSAYLDPLLYGNLRDRVYRDQKHLELVRTIRARYHPLERGEAYLNNFEWARARLLQELPEAIDEIERSLANSKFFRSLILIVLVLSVFLLAQSRFSSALIAVLVAAFSLVRYFHKRRKAVQTAYKYVIFLENYFASSEGAEVHENKKNADPPIPEKFVNRLRSLAAGFDTQPAFWQVDGKSRWSSRIAMERPMTIYCLEGKGWLRMQSNHQNRQERIWISRGCSVSASAGNTIEVDNTTFSPLLLATFKI